MSSSVSSSLAPSSDTCGRPADSPASVPLPAASDAAARKREKNRKKHESRARTRAAKHIALELATQRAAQLRSENFKLEERSRKAEGVLESKNRLFTASEARAKHAESKVRHLERTLVEKSARAEAKTQELVRALAEKSAEAATAKFHLADKFRECREVSAARAAEFVNDPSNSFFGPVDHGISSGLSEAAP